MREELVSSTKVLGVQIMGSSTWSLNGASLVKKVQQHLHFICQKRRAHLPTVILRNHRDQTNQLHHCLVWKLQSLRLEVCAKSGKDSRETSHGIQ